MTIYKVVSRPVFKAKFKQLALSHPGIAEPFPGKTPIRWAIVDVVTAKFPCYYEGKPSRQALEMLRNIKGKRFFLLQFDRAGVFNIADVRGGDIDRRLLLSVESIRSHYHGGKTCMDYFDQFNRREKGEQPKWNTQTKNDAFTIWR